MIIITGGKTSTGSALAGILSEKNEVVVSDFSDSGGDISRIKNLISEKNPVALINCDGLHGLDECEHRREECYILNSYPVRGLAAQCAEKKVLFVQMSSSYIFNGRKNSPYLETDEPDPLNHFGDSKLLAEKYILESGAAHLIVRFPDIYYDLFSMLMIPYYFSNELDISSIKGAVISPVFSHEAATAVSNLLVKKYSGTVNFSQGGHFTATYLLGQLMVYLKNENGMANNCFDRDYSEMAISADRPMFNVLDNSKYSLLTGASHHDPVESIRRMFVENC